MGREREPTVLRRWRKGKERGLWRLSV